MAKVTESQREKAEADKVVRKMLRKQYPTIELALDELAGSHLYGDHGTLLEALVEVARERVIELLTVKHPLLAGTIAHLEEKIRKLHHAKSSWR